MVSWKKIFRPRPPPPLTFSFRYKRYRERNAPIVPLQIWAKGRWHRLHAYVDSGAAYSILTTAEARRLGLMRIKARRLTVTTSGGRTEQISLHRLWVRLGRERLSITFGVPRGFDVDFNLLGRRDLFSRYVVTFDDAKGNLSFARHRPL